MFTRRDTYYYQSKSLHWSSVRKTVHHGTKKVVNFMTNLSRMDEKERKVFNVVKKIEEVVLYLKEHIGYLDPTQILT